ncbi:unnamed protein product [Closterium sp. Naga37s-1]|nr:unnamed protein product [Closterium sp. Naga37s-1]
MLTGKRSREPKCVRGNAGPYKRPRVAKQKCVPVQGVASAAQGASQVTPNVAVASSVGAGDEAVGSDGEGEAAPVCSKAVASVIADAPGTANDKADTAPPPPVPDNPFVAMPCASAQQASGSQREETFANDNVVISRAELEALKTARDDSDRRIARLEALLLAAQDLRVQNKRPRGPGEERARGDARSSKRRQVESGSEDASSAEDDEEEAEAEPVRARRERRRRHMTVSSSPILQEAFKHAGGKGMEEDLTLSTWSESKSGMIFASGAFTACAMTAFQPKRVTGTVTVKLYQMAWLEHVVTDTILNWDKCKARLSNSAGGNAQVVNGLHEVAGAAVAQAIQDFKPKYDADAAAWVWGEHGLMLSSCRLEHLIPGRYAQRAPAVEEGASVSRGSA